MPPVIKKLKKNKNPCTQIILCSKAFPFKFDALSKLNQSASNLYQGRTLDNVNKNCEKQEYFE